MYDEAIDTLYDTSVSHDPLRGSLSRCDSQKMIMLVGFCCTLVHLESQSIVCKY